MGYRSEVILAVGPEVMPQFMVTMAKSPAAREMCWADHDHMVKDYCDIEGAFLFRWDGIKWYDTFPEVQAIIDFMQWCHDTDLKDENYPENRQPTADEFFKFIRVGEESDDIEHDGYCDDFEMYTQTTIEVY